MAKKKKDKEKPKSYAETCGPKSNGCTGGGTGPNCMDDSEVGGQDKRECLKDAQEACEKTLEKCLEACQTARENRKKEGKAAIDSGQNALFATGDLTSCGRDEISWGYAYDHYTMYRSEFVGVDTNYPRWYNQEYANCCAYCYRIAAANCETSQCYCSSLKCEGPSVSPNGVGTTDGPEEPTEEEPKYVDKFNKINTANYATTSNYGLPIELVFSRSFMPGNVTWLGPLTEERTTNVTSIFDRANNTYYIEHRVSINNTMDMHLGLCAGEIGGAKRIFINGAEVADLSLAESETYIILNGAESQKVRQEYAESVGFGLVPAHRGTAMMIIKAFDVDAYKNFPVFKVEVITDTNDDPLVAETAAQSGLDTSNIWKVDTESGRVFYEAVHKVRASKYSTLETVRDEPTDYAREVTPLGNYITYSAGKFNVLYPYLSESHGDYTARASYKTFLFPTFDNTGNDYLGLFTFNTSGELYVEQIDETRGLFYEGVSVTSFDTEPPQCAFRQTYSRTGVSPGTTDTITSAFFFRVKSGVTDTVRVVEALFSSTNAATPLLKSGSVVTHDLPASAFDNSATVTLKGAIPCKYDSSILIFASFGSTNRVVKWSVENGVIWKLNVPSLPDFGRYAQLKETNRKTFGYIAPDNETYIINMDTGEYAHVEDEFNVFPGLLDGKQFYDSDTASITYQSEDSKITRIYLNRKNLQNATVGDAIRAIADRANISRASVLGTGGDTREIIGFRSGNALTGMEMISQLNKVYPFALFSEDAIDVTMFGSASVATLDEDDYEVEPPLARKVETKEDISVELSYYDDDLNGDIAKQTFFVDRFFEDNVRPVATQTYQWTVLETADYMRQLAELMSYTTTFLGNESGFTIPPKFLAFTVGDIVTALGSTRRLTKVTIGANNNIDIAAREETPSVYADVISLSGVPNVAATTTSKKTQETYAAPLTFSMRGVNPTQRASAYSFFGAYAPYDEFGDTCRIGPASKSTGTTTLTTPTTLTDTAVWGRLVEAPPTLTVSFFQTFKDQYLRIKFPTLDFVDRILAKDSYYGLSPDQRTVDPYYNTLAVGYEIIQYGVATQDPGDPYTIVFTNLLRARHNTDDNTDHVVGEFCAVLDENVVQYYIPNSNSDGKVVTINGSATRRSSAQTRVADALPLSPYLISRQDYPSTFPSALNPSNPHVMIVVNHREENANGFTDSVVNLNVAASSRQMYVYLLRSTFNLSTFNAHRYGTATSYIMYRSTTKGSVDFGETNSPVFTHACLFDTSSQNSVAWSWANEPLTAVIVDSNVYGESLAYATWNNGAILTGRTHRGLNV